MRGRPRRVGVGAFNHLDAITRLGGQLGQVARDNTDGLAAVEEVCEHAVADIGGGRGNDDRSSSRA